MVFPLQCFLISNQVALGKYRVGQNRNEGQLKLAGFWDDSVESRVDQSFKRSMLGENNK